MIYIDPPYNTGNDFVYCDDFAEDCKEYLDKKEVCDADGNRLFVNKRDTGHYHSNWCNMMYPRLKMARDLLTNDGVIFISIDDHEVANLKKICDEIFGNERFVGMLIWKTKTAAKGQFDFSISCLPDRNTRQCFRKRAQRCSSPRVAMIKAIRRLGSKKALCQTFITILD